MTEDHRMNSYPVDATRIQGEMNRTLLAAWQRWRGDELLPCRGDMQLSEIVNLLPFLTIMEARSPDEFIIRLIGTAISSVLGTELTGKNYLDLAAPEVRPLRAARMNRQLQQPCGSILTITYTARSELSLETEALALPMRPLDPRQPLQLLSLVVGINRSTPPNEVPVSNLSRLADEFHFLDIGAGVPVDPVLEMRADED